MEKRISRRSFLKGGMAAACTLAATQMPAGAAGPDGRRLLVRLHEGRALLPVHLHELRQPHGRAVRQGRLPEAPGRLQVQVGAPPGRGSSSSGSPPGRGESATSGGGPEGRRRI